MPPLPPPVANTHGVELPPRYRICLLTEEYTDWVKALYSDGFLLRTTPWVAMSQAAPPGTSPANLARRAFTELDGFHRYLTTSGLSYAIFDTEYAFKRPGSVAAGGYLYWEDDGLLDMPQHQRRDGSDSNNNNNSNNSAEADRMAEAMDFPLVCYGLSFDGFAPPPAEVQQALRAFYPLRAGVFALVDQHLDRRPLDHPDRQPLTRPGQVLVCNCYSSSTLTQRFGWYANTQGSFVARSRCATVASPSASTKGAGS